MYKGLVVASVLLAQAAHAENFYNCKIDYSALFANGTKQVSPRANIVVSDSRTSTIELADAARTKLTLSVGQNGKLAGSMNRDYYEITGDVQRGSFFYKFNTPHLKVTYSGSIECGNVEKQDFAFVRRGSNEIIRQQFPLQTPVNYKLYCVIGSVERAESALKASAVSVVNTQVTKAGLTVTVNEQKCEESSGSYDDYQCHKRGPVKQATYTLEKCDRPDLVDPR